MYYASSVPPAAGNTPPTSRPPWKGPAWFPFWVQWLLGFGIGLVNGLLPSLLIIYRSVEGPITYGALGGMGFMATMIGVGATPVALLLFLLSVGLCQLVHRFRPALALKPGTLPAFWAGLAVGFFLLLVLWLSSCAVSCSHLDPTSCS